MESAVTIEMFTAPSKVRSRPQGRAPGFEANFQSGRVIKSSWCALLPKNTLSLKLTSWKKCLWNDGYIFWERHHTCKIKREYHSVPIIFGRSRRAAWLNPFIPIQVSLNQKLASRVHALLAARHARSRYLHTREVERFQLHAPRFWICPLLDQLTDLLIIGLFTFSAVRPWASFSDMLHFF